MLKQLCFQSLTHKAMLKNILAKIYSFVWRQCQTISSSILPSVGKPDCHDTCAATVPQRNMLTGVVEQVSGKFCWGPGPKNCQRMNKVTCAKQCNGRCYGPEVTHCCNIECAGGCNGPLKTDCWVSQVLTAFFGY